MSLKGLRFTLEVDGCGADTFCSGEFQVNQNQSYPFVMSVDVASDSFMQTAEMLLGEEGDTDHLAGRSGAAFMSPAW